jgi:hypothetical protein
MTYRIEITCNLQALAGSRTIRGATHTTTQLIAELLRETQEDMKK